MNGESGSIYGLVSFHDIPILIHQDQIRDADLREVLRERIEPEMVGKDRIADTDMARNTLIETSFLPIINVMLIERGSKGWLYSKDAERCS